MDFPDFELERVQSIWENQVDYNLTESGLHPFTLRELLDDRQLDQLLSLRLGYTQTNGTVALRQAISSRYAGAGIDNVLVTSGSAEANFIASIQTLKPGDELVYMVPNYMQIWGIAQGLGARPRLCGGASSTCARTITSSKRQALRTSSKCTRAFAWGNCSNPSIADFVKFAASHFGPPDEDSA